ncbi:MAG TPA: LLM class flavin-dependent oxidoreductase [Acidimicrobiales bacterium]|nr:LLM class flavin-dependent oxidoreductase [Acidimicrobiales bacterium]
MKLGVLAVANSPAEIAERARRAEASGIDAVWAAELYDRAATIGAAAVAQATERVAVGTGIAYAFGRTPMVLAAEARNIDSLSGGRFVLGLGTGTVRMQQDWMGLDGTAPAARLEELVTLLRKLWRVHEGPVDHDGRFYRVRLQPTAVTGPPLRMPPVYLAGFNKRMIAAAGAVADGFIGHPVFTPEYVDKVVRPALESGARRAGRDGAELPVVGYVICAVDEDPEVARRWAAGQVAYYATVKTYAPVFELHGFEAVVSDIRAAWERRDLAAMAAVVPDEMVDVFAAAGTADDVRRKVHERWSPVYDQALLYPAGRSEQSTFDLLLSTFAR